MGCEIQDKRIKTQTILYQLNKSHKSHLLVFYHTPSLARYYR